jgi:putative acetyltransferase
MGSRSTPVVITLPVTRPGEPALRLRPIDAADEAAIASTIRAVMTDFGCVGAGYSIEDAEVGAMARAYAAAGSEYWVVERAGVVLGGGGFAALKGWSGAPATCELRKMYFRHVIRGLGAGRALLELLLGRMRTAGYARCYLETVERMHAARRLYESCGFEPLPGPLGSTGHTSCDRHYARAL